MGKEARSAFCSRWRETFEGDPSKVTLYKDIENGIAAPGVENYLPLFFDETETLFDYIGSDASLILLGDVNSAIEHFDKETEQRAKFLRADGERPILDFKRLYLSAPQFLNSPATTLVCHSQTKKQQLRISLLSPLNAEKTTRSRD